MKTILGMSIVALIGVGCASQPAPRAEVASALAAVRGAEEAGALQHPQAALHVKLAEEQLRRAEQLMEDDKNARAQDLAVRAYQDAELAIALAREAEAESQLNVFVEHHPSLQTGGQQSSGGDSPNSTPSPQSSNQ